MTTRMPRRAAWRLCVACLLLLTRTSVFAQDQREIVYTEDFESGKPWHPEGGIKAEVVPMDGRKALQVSGTIPANGYRYAGSGNFNLQPGAKYVVRARVKVDKMVPAYAPFIKLAYIAPKPGWLFTSEYDVALGGWQVLEGEFTCPPDAGGGRLDLEQKLSASAVTILAWVEDVSVTRVDEFPSEQKYRFKEPPVKLAALGSVHPRLHLNAEALVQLKTKIGQEPYRSFFNKVQTEADMALKSGPPPYQVPQGQNDEQLWQRDVGSAMPNLAMSYLLTGDKKYLEGARQYLLASAGYKTWGGGSRDGTDLAAGHQLYGMAIAYDWLYRDLDEKTRSTVRDCLAVRGQVMFLAMRNRSCWWYRQYLQNHMWVNQAGLAAAGLALYGDVKDVDGWLLLPLENFRKTLASLGPDGASHEGAGYWSYGLEYLLKFADLYRALLGEDLLKDSRWFAETASFAQYSVLPAKYWTTKSSVMSFADSNPYFWYGPDFQLRFLAGYYRDGHAQWLADALDKAGCSSGYGGAAFLNLLWYDPSITPSGPESLPTFKHFKDIDLVFMRSGWDGQEALLAFKCGPHIGHYALGRFSYDPGSWHVHPDAGSFQLYAGDDWLIAGSGYTAKHTEYENTALINGKGQMVEGEPFLAGEQLCLLRRGPSILRAEAGKEYDYVIADVTAAYADELGLKRYLRHVLFLKPSCWVIVDEFETAAPATCSLYFHANYPFLSGAPGQLVVKGNRGSLRLTTLGPDEVKATTMEQTFLDSGKVRKSNALVLSNSQPRNREVFVTVLESCPNSQSFVVEASMPESGQGPLLQVNTPARAWKFHLNLDRAKAAESVFEEVR